MNNVAFISGLTLGFSLIMAIGPQNAFVITQGLQRKYVFHVVLVCILCDVILILLGVLGAGNLIARVPKLLEVLSYAAIGFLLYYAYKSFLGAFDDSQLISIENSESTCGTAILTILGLSFLNPHVYIDTFFLLGSLSAQHGYHGRYVFGGGAILASIIWFCAIGFLSHLLAPVLKSPFCWRVINVGIGIMLLWACYSLFSLI